MLWQVKHIGIFLITTILLGCNQQDASKKPEPPSIQQDAEPGSNQQNASKDAEPQLVADATFLTVKNKDADWISQEIELTSKSDPMRLLKGRLLMKFSADAGKSTGKVVIGVYQTDFLSTSLLYGQNFSIEQKSNKRILRIMESDNATGIASLEYSIESDQFIVQNGVVHTIWAGYNVNFPPITSFNLGRGNPTKFLKQ